MTTRPQTLVPAPAPLNGGDGADHSHHVAAAQPALRNQESPSDVDALLVQRLVEMTNEDPDLWTSKGRNRRDDVHSIFSYPAMMVPRVQRALIGAVLSTQPGVRTLYDPFVGAGTSLVAAMPLGLDCYARDINPLAVLVSRVKTGPYHHTAFARHAHAVVSAAKADSSREILTEFGNCEKWFKPRVVTELSRLRRAIRAVTSRSARRFLWVTLAETVRLTSNDRLSTFKLHARPLEEIKQRDPSPIQTFEELAARHVADLEDFCTILREEGVQHRGRYTETVSIALGDARTHLPTGFVPPGGFDLLITSPPYGDNHTTVPYGQHAFLPLQWIDLGGIHNDVDRTCLRTTQEIDRRSLGGTKAGELEADTAFLCARSDALARTVRRLRPAPPDRIARVVSFYADLQRALVHAVAALRLNAYLIFTVGNRRVEKGEVPNDEILTDLLRNLGVVKVTEIEREIVQKRMPTRNGITDTMRKEDILIYRRDAIVEATDAVSSRQA